MDQLLSGFKAVLAHERLNLFDEVPHIDERQLSIASLVHVLGLVQEFLLIDRAVLVFVDVPHQSVQLVDGESHVHLQEAALKASCI